MLEKNKLRILEAHRVLMEYCNAIKMSKKVIELWLIGNSFCYAYLSTYPEQDVCITHKETTLVNLVLNALHGQYIV